MLFQDMFGTWSVLSTGVEADQVYTFEAVEAIIAVVAFVVGRRHVHVNVLGIVLVDFIAIAT